MKVIDHILSGIHVVNQIIPDASQTTGNNSPWQSMSLSIQDIDSYWNEHPRLLNDRHGRISHKSLRPSCICPPMSRVKQHEGLNDPEIWFLICMSYILNETFIIA